MLGRGTNLDMTSSGNATTSSGDGMVEFSFMIGFYDDDAREPSTQEIESLFSSLSLYFEEKLQNTTSYSSISVSIMIVDWQYTAGSSTPMTLHFSITAMDGNGSPVPPIQVYEALKLDSNDLSILIQNYIQKLAPTALGENVFANANQIIYEDHAVAGSVPGGYQMPSPAPAYPPAAPSRNGMFIPPSNPAVQTEPCDLTSKLLLFSCLSALRKYITDVSARIYVGIGSVRVRI